MKKRVIILVSVIIVLVVLGIIFLKTNKDVYYSLLDKLDDTNKIVATFNVIPEDGVIIDNEYETYEIEITEEEKITDIISIIKSSTYDEYLGEVVRVVSDSDSDITDNFELEFLDSNDENILTINIYTDYIEFNRYKGLYSNDDDYDTLISLTNE